MKRSASRAVTAAVFSSVTAGLLLAAAPGDFNAPHPLFASPARQTTQTPPQGAQAPVFRAGASFVTVDAYPQRDGRVVEGLTAADFEVAEDGKPQKIETFEFVKVEPGLPETERRDPSTQEEGNAQAADPRNRVFVIYLDAYHVTIEGSHRARRPLVDMLSRILAPNDLFGVMTPMMRPRDLILGRRTLGLEDQLTKYWPWGERETLRRDPEELAYERCFDGRVAEGAMMRKLSDIMIDRRREDIVLTHLEALMGYLGALRETRKAAIIFTDGWRLFGRDQSVINSVTGPGGGTMPYIGDMARGTMGRAECNTEVMRLFNLDNAQRHRDLIEAARRNNVTFYPVNPGGLAVFDRSISESPVLNPNAPAGMTPIAQDMDHLRDRSDGLRSLADNTGGLAVIGTNDLSSGLAKIVNDVSAYYLLGYYSTNTKLDGKYRRIDVKLKQKDVRLTARRGYLAPKESERAASPAAAATPAAAVAAPVTAALGILSRLRPSSDVFTYGVSGVNEIVLAVEIASSQIEAGKWGQGAAVQVTATTASGETVGSATGRIEPGTRSVLLRLPLDASKPAAPAGASWRIAVKVSADGTTLDERMDVTVVTGKLLGEAVAFRATPAARSPLRAVADFELRRTERLHIEWPILKALDRREVRVLGKSGQPLAVVATATEREVAGQNSLAVDVSLAPLAPGDYVVEITAGSGEETERKFVAFRLVR